MKSVKIYTIVACPYCINAKRLLTSKNVEFHEIKVDNDPAMRQKLVKMSGQRTVPQIWIGDTHVGGYQELATLERSNSLDDLLAN